MMQGYYLHQKNPRGVFDLFYRKREGINYGVFAGLASVIEYVKNLRFDRQDIAYLKSTGLFEKKFLDYLQSFRFSGSIKSVREGEIVFADEPLLVVDAPMIEAQLIETALLNMIGYQTLVASKASRIKGQAGKVSTVIEFGVRRAHGYESAVLGARAAMIGGCDGTSNVLCGKQFGAPVYGTHAHSWVMSFETELEAFETYANLYPEGCMLLVDTYDTLKSGVPNAIKVFDQLKKKKKTPLGIRLDSGDLAYLSKQARKMLDNAGHQDVKIFVSGDVDEYVIETLRAQNSKIDSWGVGGKLITGGQNPLLGCVYKLVSIEDTLGARQIPKMKYSDNDAKTTNPGQKTVHRIYDKDGMAVADLVALSGESVGEGEKITLTHPVDRWKHTTLCEYSTRELLHDIFVKGTLVYKEPVLKDIAAYAQGELSKFWDEYKRVVAPHIYKVNLSDQLYDLKQSMLQSKNEKY